MKKMLTTLTVVAAAMIVQQSYAHTMWLKIAPAKSSATQQTVDLYFGEFSDDKVTPLNKWFSDIKSAKIYLIQPNGNKIQLTDSVEHEDRLSYTFTATQNGVYQVYMEHEVKDVFKEMKITYASADYFVKKSNSPIMLGAYNYHLKWNNPNKKDHITYLFNNEIKPEDAISIAKKGDKKSFKTVYTDKNGQLIFPKGMKGAYLLEIVDQQEVDLPNIKKTYKMFTYRIDK